MTDLLDQALGYAARGWHILPLHSVAPDGACTCGRGDDCPSPAKHPRTRNGLLEATTDPDTIRAWFARWRDLNLGIRTGVISGILVLDVDPDHGGELSLEDLEQSYHPLPPGPRGLTGGDGMHYLFVHPDGEWGNRAAFRPGLDIRGDGGYIVAPPSLHISGNRYEWLGLDLPLPDAPGWLLDTIRKPDPPARKTTVPAVPRSTDGSTPYGLAALDREISDLATAVEGTRNNTLAKVAMQLYELVNGGELDATLVDQQLRSTAHAIGLGDHEIEQTLRSALARTAGVARNAPPRPVTTTAPPVERIPPPTDDDAPTSGPPPRTPAGTEAGAAAGVSSIPVDAPAAPADNDEDLDRIPAGLSDTDVGNARRLVAAHGHDLRWISQWRAAPWLIWNGQRWQRDRTGEIDRRAKDTADAILVEAAMAPDTPEKTKRIRFALDTSKRPRIEAMIALARTEPGVPIQPMDLDADPWLLNVENGTLDLRTGELRPHARDDLITKIAPVVYDPDARHPVWEQFLHEATNGDAQFAAFLARAVGYSLTGSTAEEVLFFLLGRAATGKSTFIAALESTLGDYSTHADFETFLQRQSVGNARPDIARLAGARFVNSVEVDDGAKLAEGLVKTLTGGDLITARFLFGDEFEYRPQFKLWLAANHAPRVGHGDDAIWRRILRIPFDTVIPKERRDPAVKQTLTDPAQAGPAILAWAVRGCIEWQRHGLQVPAVITTATGQYRADMDPLKDFLEEYCDVGAGEGYWVTAAALRKAYEDWAHEVGLRKTLHPRDFAEALRAHGCDNDSTKRVAGRSQRVWSGVRLRGQFTVPDGLDFGTVSPQELEY